MSFSIYIIFELFTFYLKCNFATIDVDFKYPFYKDKFQINLFIMMHVASQYFFIL